MALRATCRIIRLLGRAAAIVALAGLAGAFGLVTIPRAAGYSTIVVQGRSMGDAAPIGSVVLTRPAAPHDIRVDDVIIMRRQDLPASAPPVLHRVTDVYRQQGRVVVRTKGDANSASDPTPYVVEGQAPRMEMAIPGIGWAVGWLATPLGWTLGVLLPSTVLTALVLIWIWRDPPERRVPRRSRRVVDVVA